MKVTRQQVKLSVLVKCHGGLITGGRFMEDPQLVIAIVHWLLASGEIL